MTTTHTAASLLRALAPYGPSAEGFALVFDTDVPESLWGRAVVLQTGLVAILTGRKWIGIDERGHGASRHDGVLQPGEPIPLSVVLLTVTGGCPWVRVRPHWHTEFPELFAEATKKAVKP